MWQILKTDILLSKFLSSYCLRFTENIAYHVPEMIICAEKFLMMGHSGYLHVFSFAILLKSQKLDARKIFIFYSITLL